MKKSKNVSKELRFAVVGAGHMGTNHIKKVNALSEKLNCRVSVVMEPDELRRQSLKREFPAKKQPQMISSFGQLSEVSPENYPDAAIIAVPASIHVEMAEACLSKGLHCLVEKPLGFSGTQCKDLERLAAKKNLVLHVGLLERWVLAHLWGQWKPKKGPWTINAVRMGPFVPRVADTDVVHDLMIHDIDMYVLLESVFGLSPIEKVRAWGRKLRSGQLDFAVAAFDLKDGGMARFFASRLSADSSRGWELTGPDWHASIDFMRRNLKRFNRVGRGMNAFEAKEVSWAGSDPLGIEIEAFVRDVRGEALTGMVPSENIFSTPSKIVPTPETVTRTHELIDKILSSMTILG